MGTVRDLPWAPWWRYSEVRLEARGSSAVLVGVGEPQPAFVFDQEPPVDELPTVRELRRKGRPRFSGRVRFTHGLLFAGIETAEQARRFAAHYGLLGLGATAGRGETERAAWDPWSTIPPHFDPEPVDAWLAWAARLREALQTARDDPARLAAMLTAWWVDELGDDLRLRLVEGRLVVSYGRLLTALLADVVLTAGPDGYGPTRCQARDCGRWFVPQHPQAVYCSLTCKRREQNRRQYERQGKGGMTRWPVAGAGKGRSTSGPTAPGRARSAWGTTGTVSVSG